MALLVDPRFKTQYTDSDETKRIPQRAVYELKSLQTSSIGTAYLPPHHRALGPNNHHQRKQRKHWPDSLNISVALTSAAASTFASQSLKEGTDKGLKDYLSTLDAER